MYKANLFPLLRNLVNLKTLILGGCKHLAKLPNFSQASSLEIVELYDCTNLCDIDPSILSSHTLKSLDVSRCIKLECLQSEVHLKSLKYLDLDNCSSLKEFSLTLEAIEK